MAAFCDWLLTPPKATQWEKVRGDTNTSTRTETNAD